MIVSTIKVFANKSSTSNDASSLSSCKGGIIFVNYRGGEFIWEFFCIIKGIMIFVKMSKVI